jgi:hypothetical protein
VFSNGLAIDPSASYLAGVMPAHAAITLGCAGFRRRGEFNSVIVWRSAVRDEILLCCRHEVSLRESGGAVQGVLELWWFHMSTLRLGPLRNAAAKLEGSGIPSKAISCRIISIF